MDNFHKLQANHMNPNVWVIVYFIIFQIGHGNVARNLEIPIFMILPRHFVCPTIQTNVFCVDFELNVNVVFDDNYVASENVALTLVR